MENDFNVSMLLVLAFLGFGFFMIIFSLILERRRERSQRKFLHERSEAKQRIVTYSYEHIVRRQEIDKMNGYMSARDIAMSAIAMNVMVRNGVLNNGKLETEELPNGDTRCKFTIKVVKM